MKIVVFDLDETLGYFTQFSILLNCLGQYIKNKHKQSLTSTDFNSILTLFSEYLRPNIINILNYLKKKKQSKICHKIMLYTNNIGPREWTEKLLSYLEEKIDYKLFDQIISAFKVNGKIVEVCRTTNEKTFDDFIKCTKLPLNAEICFIDDMIHSEMTNENVYYINVKPYYYDYSFEEIIKRLKNSEIGKKIINEDDDFEPIMFECFKKYNYKSVAKDTKEYNLDKIIGKYIITHLQKFFHKSNKSGTMKKRKAHQKNKTSRNPQG
jgi:FMN phosphatase YigB (HAD superfamily)